MLDITWSALGKIFLAGLGTYVFLPAFLVLRDFVLWKVINTFILNNKLRDEIKKHAILVHTWNKNFAVNGNITMKDGKTSYKINGREVSFKEWDQHHQASEKMERSMEKTGLYIRRKSSFLNWMLKHYKQDATNPIDEWFKNDGERLKKQDEEKTANNAVK